ncbi:MAG: 2'-5' RNA ligase family protein [Georgenia sp.]
MRLPERVGDQVRIGVTLKIPEPYSAYIQAVRARMRDPLAHLIPPHITLLPPTVIEPDQVDDVVAHLHDVAARHGPFVVAMRGTDTFRPVSPVVFVRVEQGLEECAALEQEVRAGLLAQDLHFPYVPHITLAHEVEDARLDEAARLMADFHGTYAAGSMRLYEHGDDGMWRVIARAPLSGRHVAHQPRSRA